LENGREADPEEIRNVDEGNPTNSWIYSNHRPNESDQHEEDVDRGEVVVLQTELKISEGEVKNEIQDERQSDHEWNLFLEKHDEHLPERNSDEDIQEGPHRSEDPRRRSPRRFNQLVEICIGLRHV
jgi:hypothetical protein